MKWERGRREDCYDVVDKLFGTLSTTMGLLHDFFYVSSYCYTVMSDPVVMTSLLSTPCSQ